VRETPRWGRSAVKWIGSGHATRGALASLRPGHGPAHPPTVTFWPVICAVTPGRRRDGSLGGRTEWADELAHARRSRVDPRGVYCARPALQLLEQPMTPPRLLVVDDNPAVRQVWCESLTALGYAVTEAEDGHAALARFDAAAFTPPSPRTESRRRTSSGRPTKLQAHRARLGHRLPGEVIGLLAA